MGTRLGMMKEGANLFRYLRTQRVFNFGGVIVHHILIDSKSLAQQALGEAMPPKHMAGASLAARGKGNGSIIQLNQPFLCHQQKRSAVGRELGQGIGFHDAAAGVLLRMPNCLQEVID